MTGLLVQALKRVSGKDGEPVIQLKTAFGGGKTHSMLALYHIMRGRVSADRIPSIKPVWHRQAFLALPKANVAAGGQARPHPNQTAHQFSRYHHQHLWGGNAAQLAESAGRPELYDFVKDADKKGVSPGRSVEKSCLMPAAPA